MTSTQKKRIEFIDLAKGVCILLVVLGHCGVDFAIPGFVMMRMPLYFILSGLFFKDYGGLLDLTIKKINKIFIPFLFFYVIAYIPFYIFEAYKPGLIISDARGIFDVFNNRQFFNGPIWFLLTLFWVNIIFCIISLNIKREYARGMVTVLIGLCGITLGRYDIFLPCFLDVAMTALPYFYMGYILKKTPLLFPNKYDRYNFLIVIIGYLVTFIISTRSEKTYMSFHYNHMFGNILLNYIGSFTCVVSVLMLCKMIKHLPIVSFCGRYSIILLCLHHLVYRPVKLCLGHFFSDSDYIAIITATITVVVCIAFIPFCIKYIPMFTAQKDILTKEHLKSLKHFYV